MSKNIEVVKGIYAAFGRGDAGAIIETLEPEVIWEYAATDHRVPWLTERRGREGALAFFGTVAQELAITRFDVTHIAESGALVIAVITLDATVKRTGKTIHEENEVHLWHFAPSGRVHKFRHVADTYQHWKALQPG